MAGNAVTLTFAGDASKLSKAAAQATAATDDVTKAVGQSGEAAGRASGGAKDLTSRLGSLGAATMGASTAIGDAAGTMQALVDVQQAGARRAMEQARAIADVEQAGLDAEQALADLRQAQLDLNQSQIDAKQAGVDAEQALLDQKQAGIDATQAQKDYNAAVKEHGAGSIEARQAAQDLAQAQLDLKQAGVDAEQAQSDLKQAQEDGKQATLDAAQATRDGKDAALDLAEAQKAAHPPDMQKWSDQLNTYAPALQGLVGIVGLVTAAQWAWNIAQLASPTTWIVLGILALVAVIVLIATKTTWFQQLWDWAWKGIKAAAEFVFNWIKGGWSWVFDTISSGVKSWWGLFTWFWGGVGDLAASFWDWLSDLPGKIWNVFKTVGEYIVAPFRWAFNLVSDAWNNTIGRLSWTVPSWIPGIGGNTISAPQLPKFHTGGTVPGTPGQEVPILALAGEEVLSPTESGGSRGGGVVGTVRVIVVGGDRDAVAYFRKLHGQYGIA